MLFVVEVADLSVVVMALETAVLAGLISAVVASQVWPSELTHHVTLMTANEHTAVRLTAEHHAQVLACVCSNNNT